MDVERAALEAFRRVCDLAPAEREAALAGLPGTVQARVASMLKFDQARSALDAPEVGRLARAMGEEVARRDLEADGADGDLAPGDELGTYRILRRIGAGGMGVVYEAEQDHPRRRVALKTVHPFLRDAATRERFDAEVRLLGGLLHPAIPQAYAAFTEGEAPWLAMELVEGEPVDRATAGWSERACVALLAELGDAVHHAAERGVVHGDIQPGNVLVTREGRPKLLDFGLARSFSDDSGRRHGGTRGFVSPGQVVAAGSALDTRSDVFSLGQLGRTLIARPHADVHAILARATATSREDRYPSARALTEDLRRFLAHEPVLARPATALYRLERFARRHRSLLVTAAASLALGSAVWGGAAWSEMRARQALVDQAAQRIALELDAVVGREVSESIPALADLYTRAPTPDLQRRALLALTQALLAAYDGDPAAAVRRLGELGAVPAEVEAASARYERALDERQPGWLAAWGRTVPVADRGLGWGFFEVSVDPATGEGWAVDAEHQVRPLGPAGLGLSIGQVPGGERWMSWIVSREPLRLVTVDASRWTRVWAWRDDAFVLLGERRDTNIRSALADDGGVWVGSGPPGRGLLRLDAAGWSRPAPGIDAVDSDVYDLTPWEGGLALAQGPWTAYAVRSLGAGGGVRWDVQVGNVQSVVPYRRADGRPGLLAVEINENGSAEVFGPDDRDAGPPAVNVVVEEAGVGRIVAALTWPAALRPAEPFRPLVGDLDGDGLDDLILPMYDRSMSVAAIRLQQRDNGFGPWMFVRGLRVRAVAQVDSDPEREVLAEARDLGARWLGVGDVGLPPLAGGGPSAAAPVDDDAVRRALSVAELGLFVPAADALERVALARDDPRLFALAAAHLERAIPPRIGETTALDRAQALLDRALAAHPEDPDLVRAALRVAQARFDAERARALAGALGEALPTAPDAVAISPEVWQVVAPESLVRRGPSGVSLVTWSDQGTLLEVPVTYAGGPVRLDASIRVHRAEIGAGIEIQLVPEGGERPVLQVGADAIGGATSSVLRIGCRAPDSRLVSQLPGPTEAASLELSQGVLGDTLVCRASDTTGSRQIPEPWREPPPGRWRLRVVAQATPWPAVQQARIDLIEVRVAGVRLEDRPLPAVLVDADAALVVALRGGDPAAIREALPRASDPLVDRLLRTEYRTLGPWLAAASPESLATRLGRVWSLAARDPDDAETANFLDDPLLVDLPVTTPEAALLHLAVARRADRIGLHARAERQYTKVLEQGPPEVARDAALELAVQRHAAGDVTAAQVLVRRWWAASRSPTLDRIWLARHHPALEPFVPE